MTEKRVKAWAVVNARGKMVWELRDPSIYRTRKEARRVRMADYGERVVPATIVYEEEK